jgi:hypothetical protein
MRHSANSRCRHSGDAARAALRAAADAVGFLAQRAPSKAGSAAASRSIRNCSNSWTRKVFRFRAGQYLYALRSRFSAGRRRLLCYLRLYVELALRARGIPDDAGARHRVPIDDETKGKLQEMRYLERTVGRTAMRTLQPLMHMNGRDLWQLYMLGK